jgi:hypothetical protein
MLHCLPQSNSASKAGPTPHERDFMTEIVEALPGLHEASCESLSIRLFAETYELQNRRP